MVLRFRERSKNPRYLAINTGRKIYVTDKAEVIGGCADDVIVVSEKHFDHIWAELQFCGYDWEARLGVVYETWKAC